MNTWLTLYFIAVSLSTEGGRFFTVRGFFTPNATECHRIGVISPPNGTFLYRRGVGQLDGYFHKVSFHCGLTVINGKLIYTYANVLTTMKLSNSLTYIHSIWISTNFSCFAHITNYIVLYLFLQQHGWRKCNSESKPLLQ